MIQTDHHHRHIAHTELADRPVVLEHLLRMQDWLMSGMGCFHVITYIGNKSSVKK